MNPTLDPDRTPFSDESPGTREVIVAGTAKVVAASTLLTDFSGFFAPGGATILILAALPVALPVLLDAPARRWREQHARHTSPPADAESLP